MMIGNDLLQPFRRNRSCYRSLGGTSPAHSLAAGFLTKRREKSDWRAFPNYAALLVLSGQGTYEDENGLREVGPGDYVQRLPGMRHRSEILEEGGPWLECFVVFGQPLFDCFCQLGITADRPVLHPGWDSSMVHRFDGLVRNLEQADESDLPKCLIRAQSIVFDIHRRHQGRQVNPLVEEMQTRLGSRLEDRADIRALLAGMPVGYERLRKLFAESTGLSPQRYRINRRMEVARQLLGENELTLAEIADRLGYPDPFSFSGQFKKETGSAPSSFRRMHS